MTFAEFALIVFAVVVLAALLATVRRRRIPPNPAAALAGTTQAVDLQAFRNLVDSDEEAFLKANVSSSDYRRLRRERLLTAMSYIRAVSVNASVLIRLGEAARHSPDPRIALAGQKMTDDAIRLRLYAVAVMLNLGAAVALPNMAISSAALLSRYEHVR